MKIFDIATIKEWDKYTILSEPITSIDLMERAATQMVKWLKINFDFKTKFIFICGSGNNGGDGFAMARLLRTEGYDVEVIYCALSPNPTQDNVINRKRLSNFADIKTKDLQKNEPYPNLENECVLIDAILGSGFNGELNGYWKGYINYINQTKNTIVSIDIPSGMNGDSFVNKDCIRATFTLSLQQPKKAFFYKNNHEFIGSWFIIDIGLSQKFYEDTETHFHYVDLDQIKNILKPKNKFDHKGNNGHGVLISGSVGMAGAAILAAKSCLKTGIGLLTCISPKYAEAYIQNNVWEAMVKSNGKKHISKNIVLPEKTTAIGVGSGISQNKKTINVLHTFLNEKHAIPMVIDADGLNILSKIGIENIPLNGKVIITPHLKEFERLFGSTEGEAQLEQLAQNMSKKHQIIIILKGAYTRIFFPTASIYFNSTGNPGMATAGSGDVLTGVLTSLLAQGYSIEESAILGVYLHGLAGDIAAIEESEESLIASDIIRNISKAYQNIKTCKK